MHLYFDSDGVFADFDTNFFNRFGLWPREVKDDAKLWVMINQTGEAFWREMPLMQGALELWERFKHHSPTVLTGCPKSNYEMAAQLKGVWWLEKFTHEKIITCLSRDKALHMANKGDVLVDDMSKNIKRWEAAGGVGVLHRDNATTIAKLEAMGF